MRSALPCKPALKLQRRVCSEDMLILHQFLTIVPIAVKRVVNVAGVECPCGGTHVKQLSDIRVGGCCCCCCCCSRASLLSAQSIEVFKIKKNKKNVKVYYTIDGLAITNSED